MKSAIYKLFKFQTAIFFISLITTSSCQKSSIGQLKNCITDCKKNFLLATDKCKDLKEKMQIGECINKASIESGKCIQQCNTSNNH